MRIGALRHAFLSSVFRHVFFMNACNLEVKDRGLGPTALCVSSCPEKQLDTLEEVQLFANINGRC